MGPRWLGAEVTRGRGGSGTEVSEFFTDYRGQGGSGAEVIRVRSD